MDTDSVEEIIESNKEYGTIEFGGRNYIMTESPWFDRFDDAMYWWKANAIDGEGNEYVVQWAFDSDYADHDTMPWNDVFSVEPF